MKKSELRREFFKLLIKQYSYSKCRILLKEKFGYSVSIQNLKRWQKRFSTQDGWNLRDDSRKPRKFNYKVTQQAIDEILALRKNTKWGAMKIEKALIPFTKSCESKCIKIKETLHEEKIDGTLRTSIQHREDKQNNHLIHLSPKESILNRTISTKII